MIDLNHGSGCQYGGAVALPDTTALIAAAIDRALLARQQEQAPRTYVSTSGLGRACLRQIQYDYLAVPKDEGRDFEPRILRIFEAGHRGEDIVAGLAPARRLRSAHRARRRTPVRLLCPRRPVQGSHRRLPGRRAGAARLSRALGEQGARRLVLEGRGEARPHPLEAGLCRADRALPGLPRAAEPGALHRAQPRHHGALQRARPVRPQRSPRP